MQWTDVVILEDQAQGDKRGAVEKFVWAKQSNIICSGMVVAALFDETLVIAFGHSRFFLNTFELLLYWAGLKTRKFELPKWKTGAYFDLSEEDGLPIITEAYEKMGNCNPAVEILILFALKQRVANAINKLENQY